MLICTFLNFQCAALKLHKPGNERSLKKSNNSISKVAKESNHMMATGQFFHNTFWFLSTLLASCRHQLCLFTFFLSQIHALIFNTSNDILRIPLQLLLSFTFLLFLPSFLHLFVKEAVLTLLEEPIWNIKCPAHPNDKVAYDQIEEKRVSTHLPFTPVHPPSRHSWPFFITNFVLSSMDQGCKTVLKIN